MVSLSLNETQKAYLEQAFPGIQIQHFTKENFQKSVNWPGQETYPSDGKFSKQWDNDNFGPIYIPKKVQQLSLQQKAGLSLNV